MFEAPSYHLNETVQMRGQSQHMVSMRNKKKIIIKYPLLSRALLSFMSSLSLRREEKKEEKGTAASP